MANAQTVNLVLGSGFILGRKRREQIKREFNFGIACIKAMIHLPKRINEYHFF